MEGVGKTTLAVIIGEIALGKGIDVVAVDLDPQRNFTDALSFVQDRYDGLRFARGIAEADEISRQGDVIILDCPPALGDATAAAIDYADITLVPVLPDLFSLSNLGLVYEFAQRQEKAPEQTAIVKVGFDRRALTEMAQLTLKERQYCVAGDIPVNRLIPYNLANARVWNAGMPYPSRGAYNDLFKKVLLAYERMLEGKFENAWA